MGITGDLTQFVTVIGAVRDELQENEFSLHDFRAALEANELSWTDFTDALSNIDLAQDAEGIMNDLATAMGTSTMKLNMIFHMFGLSIDGVAERLNAIDLDVPAGGNNSGDENAGGGDAGDRTPWGGLARIGYMTSGGSSMTFKDLFMAAGFSAGAAQATYTSLKGNGMSEYDVFQYINSRYVPNLDIGGSVTSSGIASVKQGEVWYNPAVGRPYGMDNNGMIVNTAVYMNGEEIVRQTDNYKSGQNALTSGTALPGGL